MSSKRKYKMKRLGEIGKRYYDFNVAYEKNIYDYLCCNNNNKRVKNIKCYETYADWKKYIWAKYNTYSTEKLMEFSRYLNLQIRNHEPVCNAYNLTIPVVLTTIITTLISLLHDEQLYQALENLSCGGWEKLMIMLVIEMVCVAIFIKLVISVLLPLWDTNIEMYFFVDYKEIIDELVNDRFKKENI